MHHQHCSGPCGTSAKSGPKSSSKRFILGAFVKEDYEKLKTAILEITEMDMDLDMLKSIDASMKRDYQAAWDML